MPISGLVVTLSDDKNEQARAIEVLSADTRLTIGERQKNRLPVVAETKGVKEGSRLVRQELLDIEGVRFVDVVTVNFEDVTGVENGS
jgi:hypothetical protein